MQPCMPLHRGVPAACAPAPSWVLGCSVWPPLACLSPPWPAACTRAMECHACMHARTAQARRPGPDGSSFKALSDAWVCVFALQGAWAKYPTPASAIGRYGSHVTCLKSRRASNQGSAASAASRKMHHHFTRLHSSKSPPATPRGSFPPPAGRACEPPWPGLAHHNGSQRPTTELWCVAPLGASRSPR